MIALRLPFVSVCNVLTSVAKERRWMLAAMEMKINSIGCSDSTGSPNCFTSDILDFGT